VQTSSISACFITWYYFKFDNAYHATLYFCLQLKFDMDKNDGSVKHACGRMMQSAIRQQRYRLKKKYFTPFPLHLVPKTSPVKSLTDAQWNALVEHWKNPKNVVCYYLRLNF
jgi:hypothetical protein